MSKTSATVLFKSSYPRDIQLSPPVRAFCFARTPDPDINACNAVKGVDGQNAFIKKAIIYYAENGKNEALAERIADLIFEKMKSLPLTAVSVPPQQEEQNDFPESTDIADAFLDSL